MSVKLMSAIFETEFPPTLPDSEGNGVRSATLKVVLLAIADHANDEGESAYPGLTRLELKTGLSRQGIISALDALKFNGVLSVSEERSKLNTNNYAINLGCFPCLVNHVDQHGKIVNRVTSNGQPGLPLLVNSVDLNSTLTVLNPPEEKTPKKGDLVDAALFYGKEGAKPNPTEDVLTRLDILLHANIVRNGASQSVGKWIAKREAVGESLDKWAEWMRSDDWRATHSYQYAQNIEKIRIEWPQAFVKSVDPRTNRLWKGEGFVE